MVKTAVAVCTLAFFLTSASAWAQAPKAKRTYKPMKTAKDEAAAKPVTTKYQGVTLFGGDPPLPKPPPAGFNYITWPGFHATRTGSEVFLQMSGPVTYTEKTKGLKVQITMEKVQVYLRNNLRTVITSHFAETPVLNFKLRKLKKDKVRLDIKLREKAKPTISTKTQGAYTFLVVTFPPLKKKKAEAPKAAK